MPHLVKLQQTYGDRGLKVVLVAGEPAAMIKADPEFGQAPVTVLGNGGPAAGPYEVSDLPHLFYFDKGGRVALEIEGYSDELMAQLEKRIAADVGSARALPPGRMPALARR